MRTLVVNEVTKEVSIEFAKNLGHVEEGDGHTNIIKDTYRMKLPFPMRVWILGALSLLGPWSIVVRGNPESVAFQGGKPMTTLTDTDLYAIIRAQGELSMLRSPTIPWYAIIAVGIMSLMIGLLI